MEEHFHYNLISPGDSVLCALSGGADSMYLICRMMEGAEEGRFSVRAAHYNHGIRPAALRDEEFVRDWCRSREIPLTTGRGSVRAEASRLGLGLEECARQMRYQFLRETAEKEGCTLIATAHQAGDNAETVLMNLIRGAGLKGLSGIPERRENIIRPMLTISRTEIESYLSLHEIPFVQDETNLDETYTRNRIRHQILPCLEQINPKAMEHIILTAARLGEDEAELCRQAEKISEQAGRHPYGWSVSAALLANAPRPIALRAAAQILERIGVSGYAVHLESVLMLAAGTNPSAKVNLPGECEVWREYDQLVFGSLPAEELSPAVLAEGQIRWGEWVLTCERAECPEKAYLSRNDFFLKPDSYLIRPRYEGDQIRLGKRPVKKVKELMIEEKVPSVRRNRVPVIVHRDGRMAALGGFGPDRQFLADSGQISLHIILSEELIK